MYTPQSPGTNHQNGTQWLIYSGTWARLFEGWITIHWLNRYLLDSVVGFVYTYLLDK